MTVKINADTSDGLKLESDTSGTVDVQSNGTTKMSVTSSDITAPSGVNVKLHGSGSAGTQAGLWIRDIPRVTNDTSTFEHTYINSDNSIIFTKGSSATTSSNTERMNILGNGTVTIKQYLFLDREGHTFNRADGTLRVAGENGVTATSTFDTDTTSNFPQLYFANPNGTVGSITTNGSATAFNTSSDYRLKENVNYSFTATDTLKQIKPCEFNWKTDDTNTKLHGFIAHELKTLVPEAVSGDKDELDKDGNIEPQGVDQSKLVPLLVKTIQELEARITALESE